MPASSFSMLFENLSFLFASALFIGFATTPITDEYESSKFVMMGSTLDALQMELNALEPGMTTGFTFYALPRTSLQISFHNHTIIASTGQSLVVRHVRWILPDYTAEPGVDYVISLAGTGAAIEESRHG